MFKSATDYRRGSNRRRIAECAARGLSKSETYLELKPQVASQSLIFSANVGGHRRPKPIHQQYVELKNEIGRVWKEMGLAKGKRFEDEETRDDSRETREIQEQETRDETRDEEEEIPTDSDEEDSDEEEEIPQAKGKRKLADELQYFLTRVREIRRFCWERARMSASVDNISLRPAQAAAKLIPAGIPADVLLLAMTMHWSPETRADAGIDAWDFNSEGLTNPHPGMLAVSRQVMKSRGIDSEGKLPLFGYALLTAESRVPMMLIGPAGTGKSHLTEQLANFMELPYGEAPMSAGASRSDLLGRHTINAEKPFITAEAVERYSTGGIFSFEEIDRGDPGVLIVLNNALARGKLFNPVSGEVHEKSDDFIAVSTANTFGLGANRDYGTAERLDAATLDRFRMGRIFLPLDEALEDDMLHGRI